MMNFTGVYTAAMIGALFVSLPAKAAAQQPEETFIHRCANGMVAEISFPSEDNGATVSLLFESEDMADAPLVLKLDQSLESDPQQKRYSNGPTELTFGSLMFTLETSMRYQGAPLGSVECELVGPDKVEPVMQGSNAGRYFRLARQDRSMGLASARYESIESACFFKPEVMVWGFVRSEDEDATMIAYSSEEQGGYVERFTPARLQPSDDKILFELTRTRRVSPKRALAVFASPESRDSNKPSATAGLSRLFVPEGPGIWADCYESDDIIFMAHAEGANFIVSLTGDNLILEVDGLRNDRKKRKIEHGRVSIDGGLFTLNFFDGDEWFGLRIEPKGRAYATNVRVANDKGILVGTRPDFYFSANSNILGSVDAVMDAQISTFLEDSSVCKSITEYSFGGDADERKDRLAKAREELGCEELKRRQSEVLKSLRSGGDPQLYRLLRRFLNS